MPFSIRPYRRFSVRCSGYSQLVWRFLWYAGLRNHKEVLLLEETWSDSAAHSVMCIRPRKSRMHVHDGHAISSGWFHCHDDGFEIKLEALQSVDMSGEESKGSVKRRGQFVAQA